MCTHTVTFQISCFTFSKPWPKHDTGLNMMSVHVNTKHTHILRWHPLLQGDVFWHLDQVEWLTVFKISKVNASPAGQSEPHFFSENRFLHSSSVHLGQIRLYSYPTTGMFVSLYVYLSVLLSCLFPSLSFFFHLLRKKLTGVFNAKVSTHA